MDTAGLEAVIAALAAADLSVHPAGLGPEILELIRLRTALSAQISRRLLAFEQADGPEQQTTASGWLRAKTTMGHAAAAAEKRIARTARLLPELGVAYAAGSVTAGHVSAAGAVLSELPEALWAEVDGQLVVVAENHTVSEFGSWLRELIDAIKPNPKPRNETQHEARRLSLSQGFNGMTNVAGRLTPEVAEKLRAALSAASRPDATGEVRLPNQRTADALENVVDTVLNTAALPIDGGERPHLTLGVDLDLLDEAAQRAEEEQRCSSADWWSLTDEQRVKRVAEALATAGAAADPRSGRPRYYWTGVAPVSAARRLACDAILLPILSRDGKPLDVGQQTRVVGPALRRFVHARDSHCRWPGCTMPGRWTEVHHVVHWKDGGPTDRWNLLLLCNHHHHAAHDGGWMIILHAPGVISVRRRTRADDPYYEIRLTAPPPPSELTVQQKLRDAARRLAVS